MLFKVIIKLGFKNKKIKKNPFFNFMFFFISLKNRINNKKDTHNKIYTTIESSKYKKMIYNLISCSSRYEFCDHVIFRKLKK